MAFVLTQQDKLAIMLTGAGSQRRLAAQLGISHQKLGRWLRVGQPRVIDPETGEILRQAGAKEIPNDAATRSAIANTWSLHKKFVKHYAREHGLPFDDRIPVFIYRKPLTKGKQAGMLGDRVYAEHTEFIRPEVRLNFLGLMQQSKQFYVASIRSTVNIFSYAGSTKEPNPYATESVRQRRYLKDSLFISGEDTIEHGGTTIPLYTKYEAIAPFTELKRSVLGIEKKLRAHEPHAQHLADQYLFQLIPATNQHEATSKKTSKRPAKRKPSNKRGK